MMTKAYHAFKTKVAYFNDDIELVDVLRIGILKNEMSDLASKHVLKNVDPVEHSHLARRANSDGSRRLIIDHLRQTLYTAYVKDIYEEVTIYLKMLLEKAAQNRFDAGRIIGEHKVQLDASKVLATGNWESVAQFITDSVFQSLEGERSTLKLLEKISNKLNLSIDMKIISDTLPFLEVRHYLIHCDGKIPSEFKAKYPSIKCKSGYVILDKPFINNFKNQVTHLIDEFEGKVVAASILRPEDLFN